MKTIVHVNQHVIRKNQKTGEREPVLTVKTYKNNQYAQRVRIDGPCVVVYSPDKPLSCGARVWIETDSNVEVDGDETANACLVV
jgi:hypothetical protein